MDRVEIYLKTKERLEKLAKSEHVDINKYYSPATPQTLKKIVRKVKFILQSHVQIWIFHFFSINSVDFLLTGNIWETLSNFIPNHLILSRS